MVVTYQIHVAAVRIASVAPPPNIGPSLFHIILRQWKREDSHMHTTSNQNVTPSYPYESVEVSRTPANKDSK